ncbi:alpha/beta hydrolase [Murimonas intestini]|uniref:alpha/beta hydrolase n=1 Tax=Murimonas intestini TaxID=1337051 RepID=UPI0011DDECEA|nr:alpha/beta hydrolase [Murimonas intestini]
MDGLKVTDLNEKDFRPPMADISWVKRKYLDVPYAKESKAQCLDIYLPDEGDGPFPLLVHIHGGGFAMGDKRDDHMDAYLSGIKRGFAVASVEYRLSKEAVFPAAVLDCREAIRFLRKNAAKYKINGDKIAVIGGSAGGNLAAMLAMNVPNGKFKGECPAGSYDEEPTVQAAVDQFGPMDFKAMDRQAKENGISFADHDEPFSPESKYLGIALPDAPDVLCAQANPLTYADDNMCPLLVQHGTADRLVPYGQSAEFVKCLEEKLGKGRVTFIPLEGADHEDKMFVQEKNMNLVFEFIEQHI